MTTSTEQSAAREDPDDDVETHSSDPDDESDQPSASDAGSPESDETDEADSDSSGSAAPLTQERIYEILSDKRRRYSVHYLKQHDEPISVQDLAEQVAAWENDKPIDALTSQERKRVYISLYQGHLSTLDDHGIVDYDEDRGVVEITDAVRHTDMYLEVVEPRNIPWSQFYIGLSLASLALVGVLWFEPGILEAIDSLVIAAIIAGSFLVSAIVHYFRSGRIHLGDEGPPPELRDS